MSRKKIFFEFLIIIAAVLLVSTNCRADLFGFSKDGKKKVAVGSEAPDFVAENFLTSEKINLKELKGKVVLIDFWSIYCVSCIEEISKLTAIYEKYKDKDIYFIGVDLDRSSRRLKSYLASNPFPYPIVMDKTRQIFNSYNVDKSPTIIIIGKDGNVKLYHEGYKPGDEKHIEEVMRSQLQ